MQEKNDKQILALFKDKQNREKAFNLIVQRYKERLYWHIRKIVLDHEDTDDVLQNTFIKVWGKLGDFRQESELFTWIYRIATNEALGFLRKKKRRQLLASENFEGNKQESYLSDDWYSGDEIQQKLTKAIEQLPEKQKLVFNMRYYEEMPYEKISSILKTSQGALKASYHLAVKKIEKFINMD